MPPLAIGAAIGGIGSLVGGITGAGAAHDAANAQAKAAGQSLANINDQTNRGINAAREGWGAQQTALRPYLQAGHIGTAGMDAMAGKFQAPTGVTMQNDPGYQFRLQEGQKALERSASARGTLLGGAQAKALTRYGQDFGSNEYQNVYNRALQSYDTNFGSFGALAGIGQNAVGQFNQGAENAASNVMRMRLANASMSNDALMNRGAAQASGDIGANNAWQGAIGGLSNAGMTMGNIFGGGAKPSPLVSGYGQSGSPFGLMSPPSGNAAYGLGSSVNGGGWGIGGYGQGYPNYTG